MKKIHESYDSILKANFELHAVQLGELRALVKSWYDVDFDEFDSRHEHSKKGEFTTIIKQTGVVCNYFFALVEDNEYYLLDGFNRLLTTYGEMEDNHVVYLKLITSKLEDHHLMSIMHTLNLWKLSGRDHYRDGFNTKNYLDRGFRLLLHKKFGIDLYNEEDYRKRKQEKSDFSALDYYFNNESEMAHYFKCDYKEIQKLLSQKQIINDFREVLKNNKYKQDDHFNHYDTFFHGFIMFVTRRRLCGDESEYKFKTYLDILKNDKFFKKLQNMSWTDSTRKNVYKFFNKIEEEMK